MRHSIENQYKINYSSTGEIGILDRQKYPKVAVLNFFDYVPPLWKFFKKYYKKLGH